MPRKQSPPATPDEMAAHVLAQPDDWQRSFLHLLLAKPASHIARLVAGVLWQSEALIERLEAEASLSPEAIDPEGLLPGPEHVDGQGELHKETLKAAKKRLGKPSTAAVKQARHRAKNRRKAAHERLERARAEARADTSKR
jgi:hypothetical protein